MVEKEDVTIPEASFEISTEQNEAKGEASFSPDEVERLLDAIADKNRLHEELSERLKRLQADFDNFRRRTRQEKEELSAIVSEGILLQLLPVMDNFERAITASAQADAASLKSGIDMIFRQFSMILEQLGLTPLKAVGEQFDPQRHEAVMRVDQEDQPDGLVLEELQKGYAVRNKVIRPSMVKVVNNS